MDIFTKVENLEIIPPNTGQTYFSDLDAEDFRNLLL